MPLFSKKKSTKEAEKDGSPSLSAAYSASRLSKRKKMAYGGEAVRESGAPSLPKAKPDNHKIPESESMGERMTYGSPPPRKPDDKRPPKDEYMADHFAQGGEVEEHYSSIADAILSKKRKQMADGGMVDIQQNGDETGQTPYDEDNADAYDNGYYDTSQISPQPEDSNEKGDIFGSIKRKRR